MKTLVHQFCTVVLFIIALICLVVAIPTPYSLQKRSVQEKQLPKASLAHHLLTEDTELYIQLGLPFDPPEGKLIPLNKKVSDIFKEKAVPLDLGTDT